MMIMMMYSMTDTDIDRLLLLLSKLNLLEQVRFTVEWKGVRAIFEEIILICYYSTIITLNSSQFRAILIKVEAHVS